MGKNKAQRTKDNARPSSSARSAELLSTSSTGFIGFGGQKETPLGSPLIFTNNADINSIDPYFQILLKKMGKKDAVTKFKALQEFGELCQSSDLSIVEELLVFWPRLYCALAIDNDHRVREALQVAHAALIKKVGKKIATYLKQFAGPWFVAQYDLYPPAASAASHCFSSTFPTPKFISAIIHCQDEILQYVSDNIVLQTSQSLNVNKTLTPDEKEDRYLRLLTSSLQAYSFYLKTVPEVEIIEKTLDYHKKIIVSGKFWKLAKHEAPVTKTAFFNVLTSLMLHSPSIVMDDRKKILTTIINSLDESDPALLNATWESLLVAITKFEDWSQVVSMEKMVLPKLWKVLKNNAKNCANVIYPNLLPLMSEIVKTEINKESFFTNFFESMYQGFTMKNAKFSRSEIQALGNSYFECFRYATLICCDKEVICLDLLKHQLIPVMETCIRENSRMKSTFFGELTHLVKYWSKHRHNVELPSYSSLVSTFWLESKQLLEKLVGNLAENYDVEVNEGIECSIVDLLWCLKTDPRQSRKSLKVKFFDSTESDPDPSSNDVVTVKNEVDAEYFTELQQLVDDFCGSYLERIVDRPEKYEVANFVKIVKENDSWRLFETLAKRCCDGGTLLDLYEKKIEKLLGCYAEKVEPVINFIFVMMSHLADEEKREILSSLEKFSSHGKILETSVQYALTERCRAEEVVKNWCKQDSISQILIAKAEKITETIDGNIFLKIFKTEFNGDLSVNEDTIQKISLIFLSSVQEIPWAGNDSQIQCMATLISKLLDLSYSIRSNSPAQTLLKSIFWLNVRSNMEQIEEDDSSVSKISEEAFKRGLYEIVKITSTEEFKSILKYFSSILWEKLIHSSNDSLIDLLFKLAETSIRSDQRFVIACLTELRIKDWIDQVSFLILHGQILTGNLYTADLQSKNVFFGQVSEADLENSKFKDHMDKSLTWALTIAKVLNLLLEEDLKFPELEDIVVNLVYAVTLGDIYSENHKSTQHFNTVKELLGDLKNELNALKLYLTDDINEKVIQELIRNALQYGGILPHVIKFYHDFFVPTCPPFVPPTKARVSNKIYLQYVQALNLFETPIEFSEDEKDFGKIFLTRGQFQEPVVVHSVLETFEIIKKYQKSEPLALAFDCEINKISWEKICLTLEVANFLINCIKSVPREMTIEQWDLIQICLSYWNLSIQKSRSNLEDFKVKVLIIATNKVFRIFQEFLNEYEEQPMEEIPPSLPDDWKNVFMEDFQLGVIQTWMQYAELYCDEKNLPMACNIPLDHLGRSLKLLTTIPDVGMSEDELLQWLLRILQSPVLNLQLGAYVVLNRIAEVLVEQDKAIIEVEDVSEKNLKLSKFETILKTTQGIVDVILMDFKLCDVVSCTIQPYTDSYTYMISYLLGWNVVLNMCARSHGDLRYQYGEILKDELFPSLLSNLFRLMPVEVLQDSKNKSSKLTELFNSQPSFNFSESWTEWRLDNIVCWLYKNCLRYLPVLVRQWWSTSDSRVSAAVDRITSLFVTPNLCQEELQNNKMVDVENMQIKVHTSAREVMALYTMDDTKLELKIVLPANHPLGTVDVEPGQHAGGTTNWRNCHMQLSIFLTHQNGSVWDGLKLWKSNLDKRFAGVEECCICFSIFHISTYQIPKLTCQTCRKRFHKLCLYKWFSTSHKSTCPICRNVF